MHNGTSDFFLNHSMGILPTWLYHLRFICSMPIPVPEAFCLSTLQTQLLCIAFDQFALYVIVGDPGLSILQLQRRFSRDVFRLRQGRKPTLVSPYVFFPTRSSAFLFSTKVEIDLELSCRGEVGIWGPMPMDYEHYTIWHSVSTLDDPVFIIFGMQMIHGVCPARLRCMIQVWCFTSFLWMLTSLREQFEACAQLYRFCC